MCKIDSYYYYYYHILCSKTFGLRQCHLPSVNTEGTPFKYPITILVWKWNGRRFSRTINSNMMTHACSMLVVHIAYSDQHNLFATVWNNRIRFLAKPRKHFFQGRHWPWNSDRETITSTELNEWIQSLSTEHEQMCNISFTNVWFAPPKCIYANTKNDKTEKEGKFFISNDEDP